MPLSYDDVRRAVADVVTPLQQSLLTLSNKVDALTSDHVRRDDLTALRNEIMERLNGITAQFYTKDVADARYGELRRDIADIKQRLDELENDGRTDSRWRADGWRQSAYVALGAILTFAFALLLHFVAR